MNSNYKLIGPSQRAWESMQSAISGPKDATTCKARRAREEKQKSKESDIDRNRDGGREKGQTHTHTLLHQQPAPILDPRASTKAGRSHERWGSVQLSARMKTDTENLTPSACKVKFSGIVRIAKPSKHLIVCKIGTRPDSRAIARSKRPRERERESCTSRRGDAASPV